MKPLLLLLFSLSFQLWAPLDAVQSTIHKLRDSFESFYRTKVAEVVPKLSELPQWVDRSRDFLGGVSLAKIIQQPAVQNIINFPSQCVAFFKSKLNDLINSHACDYFKQNIPRFESISALLQQKANFLAANETHQELKSHNEKITEAVHPDSDLSKLADQAMEKTKWISEALALVTAAVEFPNASPQLQAAATRLKSLVTQTESAAPKINEDITKIIVDLREAQHSLAPVLESQANVIQKAEAIIKDSHIETLLTHVSDLMNDAAHQNENHDHAEITNTLQTVKDTAKKLEDTGLPVAFQQQAELREKARGQREQLNKLKSIEDSLNEQADLKKTAAVELAKVIKSTGGGKFGDALRLIEQHAEIA